MGKNITIIKHKEIITRLKRVNGHLTKVISMLEDERNCIEIAQQLQAVEKALNYAKRTLVHDHINHCLQETVTHNNMPANALLNEFEQIAKYL